ncbi:MAG: FtsX-like permease family protein [Thermoanaerobaculia bacterium]
MGARPAMLRNAFLSLAGLLAGTGLLAGAAVGALAAWLLDRFRVLRLPDAVYFVDHVPFRLQVGDLGAIVACTLALAGLCAWAAARRAASLDPVEALRR